MTSAYPDIEKSRGTWTNTRRRYQGRFIMWVTALVVLTIASAHSVSGAGDKEDPQRWIGTWATAPQRGIPTHLQTFRNQTLRLIVHTSAGGGRIRIKISNTFGDAPLQIGAAHIAQRAAGADIEPNSDRNLEFGGRRPITIAPGSLVVSDPVDLQVPALSDLAISLFLPETAVATTSHSLALQTNYVSPEGVNAVAETKFRAAKKISSWPFLTGVDVAASPEGAAIVAFGSSLTDGDGSTKNANRRWPDVLAERLQKAGYKEIGVLNEGIIGNRLLSDSDSPRQAGGPPPLGPVFDELGPALGTSGISRFDRDVLDQAGVKYAILGLGVNDILFPGSFIPDRERMDAQRLIAGNRELITRAHKRGVRVIGSTIPPFEHALFRSPFFDGFYSPEREKVRQDVNAWVKSGGEYDGVIDFDLAVRDPNRPTQISPSYDSGDHLHVNDTGNVAQGTAIPLTFFRTPAK
jgi:lysophospholipase L1-like esterase